MAVGQEPHMWLWVRSPISVAVGQEPHVCRCGSGGPISVDVGQEAPRVDVGQEAPCGSMWGRRPHVW